jgi:hypothetical protein
LCVNLKDKVSLYNELRDWLHCDWENEYIFDLDDNNDANDFIKLYGTQTYYRCIKMSKYWMGGNGFYDNIENEDYCTRLKIFAVDEENINKLLASFDVDTTLKQYKSLKEVLECVGSTFKDLFDIETYYNDNIDVEVEREIEFKVRVKYKCKKYAEGDDHTAYLLALQPNFNTKEDGVYLTEVESDFVSR